MEKSKQTNTEGIHLVGRTASRELAGPESPALPSDLGELFLAEMDSRRERLNYWMGLIHEAAREARASAAPCRPSTHKCRHPASGQRALPTALPPAAGRRQSPRAPR